MIKYIKKIILRIFAIIGRLNYLFLKFFILNDKNDIKIQLNNQGVFFGYYDITPFNNDNSKLLANVSSLNYFRTPSNDEYIDVGYFELSKSDNNFVSIDKTNTWCWQQGCRLQWLPGDNNKIIYNKLVNGKYGAVIYDISSNEITKELHTPIYVVHPSGKSALSLNFSRLQRLRPGYGYSVLPDITVKEKIPDKDGLWLVDLENDNKSLLIDYNHILSIESEHNWNEAEHYINHIFFNPTGEYFIFFHLWKNKSGFFNRVLLYEFKSDNLHLLDNETMSACHYTFKNDYELLITLRDNVGTIKYRLHDVKNKTFKTLNSEYLVNDSHPSYINDDCILVDSYLNYFRKIKLSVLNLQANKIKRIYQGFHNLNFSGEYRCDLHPRLSPDKKIVCIDTVENNNRLIKLIKL